MTPDSIIYSDYDATKIKMTGFGYHALLSRGRVSEYQKFFYPPWEFSYTTPQGFDLDLWGLGCITYFMLTGDGIK